MLFMNTCQVCETAFLSEEEERCCVCGCGPETVSVDFFVWAEQTKKRWEKPRTPLDMTDEEVERFLGHVETVA